MILTTVNIAVMLLIAQYLCCIYAFNYKDVVTIFNTCHRLSITHKDNAKWDKNGQCSTI